MTELVEALDKYGEAVIAEIATILKTQGHVATGRLINSLRAEVVETADNVNLMIVMDDHGQYVDSGRRAFGSDKVDMEFFNRHAPPISAIKEWVKVKGIPESAAWAIRRNIFKFGIPPSDFTLTATKKAKPFLDKVIVDAMKKRISQMVFEFKNS